MGRHSAPDDPDDTEQPPAAVAVRERHETASLARHAQPDADEATAPEPSEPTERSEPVELSVAPGSAAINGVAPTRPLPPRPDSEDVTQRIPPVVDEPPTESSARPAPVTSAAAPHAAIRHAAQNSAADLHLVRSHRSVQALCAAAVLVPFAVEVMVLLVLGHLSGHSVLVWLWVPLVAAGVLLGLALDIAHRRHRPPPTAPQ